MSVVHVGCQTSGINNAGACRMNNSHYPLPIVRDFARQSCQQAISKSCFVPFFLYLVIYIAALRAGVFTVVGLQVDNLIPRSQ